MSSGDGAAGPLGDDTMDPREFEKKTQDELDDILNRYDVLCLVEFSVLGICERVSLAWHDPPMWLCGCWEPMMLGSLQQYPLLSYAIIHTYLVRI